MKIYFKEWLPDLPDLDNPGLIEASNVLPLDKTYRNFAPLLSRGAASTLSAMTGGPIAASRFSHEFLGSHLVVASQSLLYRLDGSSTNAETVASFSAGADQCQFAQYDDQVIIAHAGTIPLRWALGTTGSAVTMSSSDSVSAGSAVGVIGQFVLIGGIGTSQSIVRWSAIDDPTDWPTPGSATASARQAGQQEFPPGMGRITGIYGADQHGIIFQRSGIHRAIYVGGVSVFQFDKISENIGMKFPHGPIQVGGVFYFPTESGFYKTDGTSVVPIGEGKVDRWFLDQIGEQSKLFVAYDAVNGLIYWAFPVHPSTTPTRILIYSLLEDRFAYASQTCTALVKALAHDAFPSNFGVEGFTGNFEIGQFNGTAGSAILTSGEGELNPGGFTYVDGVRPIVDVTANAVTVALGTRDNLSSAGSFTAEVTANSRSGVCDFRSEVRYHRVRLTIAGTFNACQGIDVEAVPAGRL